MEYTVDFRKFFLISWTRCGDVHYDFLTDVGVCAQVMQLLVTDISECVVKRVTLVVYTYLSFVGT